MHKYFEDRVNQQDIPEDEFYCRYTFEVKARILDVRCNAFKIFAFELNGLPQPKPIGSCICHKPYNPDHSSEENIMHFCPRPNCRRWYHRNCLLESTYIDASDSALLSYRLLASSPDTDEPFEFPSVETEQIFDPQPPLKKHKATRPPKSRFRIETEDIKVEIDDIPPSSGPSSPTSPVFKGTKRVLLPEVSTPDPEAALSSLPTNLVTLAQQPIVKSGTAGVGGMVGNVRPVIQARRLVYDAVTNGGTLSDDWEESIDADVEAIIQNPGKEVPKLCCPECKGPI